MAHNLNIINNRASFASKKEVPWHGLGKVVDAMTSEEAIKLGGLDFEVEKRKIYYHDNKHISFDDAKKYNTISRVKLKDSNIYKQEFIVPDKFITVRNDTNQYLGIVGAKYNIIQNYEAFDFMDSIIGKFASYETVGALGNGEIIFITAKVTEELVINKDLIDKYLLLTMSHDGTSSIQVMFTPIRVVCNNTLTAATRGNKTKVSIMHTKNAKTKLELSKKILGIVDQNTLAYQEAFGILGKKQVNDDTAYDIIETALGLVRDSKQTLSSKGENLLNKALTYYHEGIGQENIVGTAWGVYNGITGYFQNVKEYRTNDAKFKNTFNSGDATIRQDVFNQLLKL
jgi:phage/plasmid-like protein (TIGR03299 family)